MRGKLTEAMLEKVTLPMQAYVVLPSEEPRRSPSKALSIKPVILTAFRPGTPTLPAAVLAPEYDWNLLTEPLFVDRESAETYILGVRREAFRTAFLQLVSDHLPMAREDSEDYIAEAAEEIAAMIQPLLAMDLEKTLGIRTRETANEAQPWPHQLDRRHAPRR